MLCVWLEEWSGSVSYLVVVSCLVVGRRIQNVTALLTTLTWGPHVGHPILSSLPLRLQEPDLLPHRPSSPRLPALLPRPELGHRRSSARSGFASSGCARGAARPGEQQRDTRRSGSARRAAARPTGGGVACRGMAEGWRRSTSRGAGSVRKPEAHGVQLG